MLKIVNFKYQLDIKISLNHKSRKCQKRIKNCFERFKDSAIVKKLTKRFLVRALINYFKHTLVITKYPTNDYTIIVRLLLNTSVVSK